MNKRIHPIKTKYGPNCPSRSWLGFCTFNQLNGLIPHTLQYLEYSNLGENNLRYRQHKALTFIEDLSYLFKWSLMPIFSS